MAYEATCQESGCDFMVRANDRDEVVEMLQEHAREVHGMDVSEQDAQSMVSEV